MARSHKMTPARRAALRKAQLASARKRRRRTVRREATRAIRQTTSAARAGGAVATRKAIRRFNSSQSKARRRKVAKTAAVAAGVGAVAVVGVKHRSTIHAGVRTRHRNARATLHMNDVRKKTRYEWGQGRPLGTPRAVSGSPTRALTMGPKGRSTVRSRRYRARKRAAA